LIFINPAKQEKATRFQVAIFMWIKEPLKYLHQKEAGFSLITRDILEMATRRLS